MFSIAIREVARLQGTPARSGARADATGSPGEGLPQRRRGAEPRGQPRASSPTARCCCARGTRCAARHRSTGAPASRSRTGTASASGQPAARGRPRAARPRPRRQRPRGAGRAVRAQEPAPRRQPPDRARPRRQPSWANSPASRALHLGNRLAGEFPGEIGKLTNLHEIYAGGADAERAADRIEDAVRARTPERA